MIPSRPKRKRKQVRAEVSDDKAMSASRSRKTRPISNRTVAAEKSETTTENATKSLAELYDEWCASSLYCPFLVYTHSLPHSMMSARARNMFIASPQTDLLQRDVWELHQNTFPAFAPGAPLRGAEELIQYIPTVFPGAKLLSVGGSDKKYVVRGITRK